MSHGQRKLTLAALTCKQLAAETCEFSQDPLLSMGVHGTFMYLNLTFMN